MLFFLSGLVWGADVVVGIGSFRRSFKKQIGDRLLLQDRVFLECISIASKNITLVGGSIEGEGRCDVLVQIANATVSFEQIALSNGQVELGLYIPRTFQDLQLDSMGSSRGMGAIYAEDSEIELNGGRINASTGEEGRTLHVRSKVVVRDLTCSPKSREHRRGFLFG